MASSTCLGGRVVPVVCQTTTASCWVAGRSGSRARFCPNAGSVAAYAGATTSVMAATLAAFFVSRSASWRTSTTTTRSSTVSFS